jgi:hypothetical protein
MVLLDGHVGGKHVHLVFGHIEGNDGKLGTNLSFAIQDGIVRGSH